MKIIIVWSDGWVVTMDGWVAGRFVVSILEVRSVLIPDPEATMIGAGALILGAGTFLMLGAGILLICGAAIVTFLGAAAVFLGAAAEPRGAGA